LGYLSSPEKKESGVSLTSGTMIDETAQQLSQREG
jgi:hypothetical protein